MNVDPYQEILTDRLVLRKLENADWRMISFLRTDKEVNKYVQRPNAPSKEMALEFIAKIHAAILQNQSYYWKLTLKDQNQMMGSICLWNFSKDRKNAEVGYDLAPQFQGKGFMREALEGLVEFGFRTLKLQKIEAYTHSQNSKSIKLLEKQGFKRIHGKKDPDYEHNVVFFLVNSDREC